MAAKKKTAKKAPSKKPAPKKAAAKKAPSKKKAPLKKAPSKKASAKKPKAAPVRAVPLEALRLETVLAASPEDVLGAWLDSAAHSAFTGAEALIEPRVGGKHSAWSGYIEGVLTAIEPERLVMTWRTTEFSPTDPDSHLELRARPHDEGTHLEIVHTRLPVGGADKYTKGWQDFYITPMRAHFDGTKG